MEMRKCIGSMKFGIEAHEAPVEDFPKQASQKDGLGRMCRVHWNQYTTSLRKAALARKAAEGEVEGVTATSAPSGIAEVDSALSDAVPSEDVTTTAPEDGPTVAKRATRRRRAADAKEVAQEGASG